MNEILNFLLKVLGAIDSVKTLGEGQVTLKLSRGMYELRTMNAWLYFRRGDASIDLDDDGLPKDATDAVIVTPEQPSYLFLEYEQRWTFLVEEGGTAQVLHRYLV